MNTKTQLTLAVIAALGLTATNALATAKSTQAISASWQGTEIYSSQAAEMAKPFALLAAKGRGKDGNKPEDNGVDAPDALDCDVNEDTGIELCIPSV